MHPRRTYLVTLDLTIDDAASEPSYLQIYRQLRAMILDGRLQAGARLMSSRSYAERLKRSRNTIASAYELLLSEGLIESRRGSGTFVSENPNDCTQTFAGKENDGNGRSNVRLSQPQLSEFGQRMLSAADWPIGGGRQFDPEGPDHRLFPFKEWGRLLRRVWQKPNQRILFDFDPGGYRPLREQIAIYLAAHPAVRCTADDIIITSGSLHGLDLVARLLLDSGDTVLFEDPGYPRGRSLFNGAGAVVVSAPVDGDGMQVDVALSRAPNARMVYVTPSRQYPTGAVMSIERRRMLLNWARENCAWVFEDDYDSDFRLDGTPLRSIQSFDDEDRVIYAGSLSKAMFPGLRLGYLVLPPGLQPLFARVRRTLDLFPSSIPQAPLAMFFEEGYFAAHVNRMRRLYFERRISLIEGIERRLGDFLEVAEGQGGIEVCTRFRPELSKELSDKSVCAAADAAGLRLQPLSIFYEREEPQQGLVFGLAILDEQKLDRNLQRLRTLLT